ncbi:MAG: serine/threonine-protein kinase [Methanoregula sp.]
MFRAKNAKTGKTVAVKVPQRFDEMTGTHFTRDIFFWQGLGHENIIGIYSTNILPVPYVEMEYAPSSLARMKLPLPEPEALAIVTGVVRGLAFAHGKGIVHRDLKPENILIAEDGTPKITDWGLGKRVNDPRQSTMIGYSPGYAAPEQVAPQIYGKPGAATDIYQVGVLFTELLTGTNPFAREGIHDTNMAILNDPAGEPSWDGRHVPEIRAIIRKCLARRPEDRYSSAADLLTDLEAVGRGAE